MRKITGEKWKKEITDTVHSLMQYIKEIKDKGKEDEEK